MTAGGTPGHLPTSRLGDTAQVPGGRLRVLMVISRPLGARDVGYQMIARPLLRRLEAVRGEVDLAVLRPPLLDALRGTAPLPPAAGDDGGRMTSLPVSIAYSYAHLSVSARRLLPAVSLFQAVTDAMSWQPSPGFPESRAAVKG